MSNLLYRHTDRPVLQPERSNRFWTGQDPSKRLGRFRRVFFMTKWVVSLPGVSRLRTLVQCLGQLNANGEGEFRVVACVLDELTPQVQIIPWASCSSRWHRWSSITSSPRNYTISFLIWLGCRLTPCRILTAREAGNWCYYWLLVLSLGLCETANYNRNRCRCRSRYAEHQFWRIVLH